MKTCPRCKVEKARTLFYTSKSRKDGLSNYCKDCDKSATQRYQARFPDRVAATRRQYRESSPEKRLWSSAKARCKTTGVVFTIKWSDIVIPETCPYLGVPFAPYGRRSGFSMSLDRILPELGYVKGNIQVISDLANRMKSNATPEQLNIFARAVLGI